MFPFSFISIERAERVYIGKKYLDIFCISHNSLTMYHYVQFLIVNLEFYYQPRASLENIFFVLNLQSDVIDFRREPSTSEERYLPTWFSLCFSRRAPYSFSLLAHPSCEIVFSSGVRVHLRSMAVEVSTCCVGILINEYIRLRTIQKRFSEFRWGILIPILFASTGKRWMDRINFGERICKCVM